MMLIILAIVAIAAIVAISLVASKSSKSKMSIVSDGSRRIVIENGQPRLSTSGGLLLKPEVVTDKRDGVYTISDPAGKVFLTATDDAVSTSTNPKQGVWIVGTLPGKGTVIARAGSDGKTMGLAPYKDSVIVSKVPYFWTVTF
jgi:hypothetical protein